jgi:predicted RNase H-like HicB family nuclease
LIFYPQPDGGYTVICPEIKGCFTEGDTFNEAAEHIRELIADMLPGEIKSELDERMFREGSCMKGKLFQDVEVETTGNGKVVFPSSALAYTAAAEMTA